MKKFFLNTAIFILLIGTISCDKDFNTIGSDVIGENNFDFEKVDISVDAFSKKTGAVQSNNLPVNHLGIYNDPAFGITKAHYVSQITLAAENSTIGDSQVIDSVYLYVPYFFDSSETVTATDGSKTYELDSVYGYNESSKFKLHVYENGYYIRDFDPDNNFESAQKYYTDDKSSKIDPFKNPELLNNSTNISQNEAFFIENREIIIYETNGAGEFVDADGVLLSTPADISSRVVKERKTPGIWLDLKNSYFQNKLFGAAASGKLVSNTLFKDYFRGLLFEVEEITPGVGSMATLDFSKAEIKILYKATTNTTNASGAPVVTITNNTLVLNIGHNGSAKRNNSINLIENTFSADFNANFNTNGESAVGADLYVKGGNGAVTYIDIPMSGPLGLSLSDYKSKGYLINEANLVFYINTTKMGGNSIEPERIYLFDATNNTPVIDYYADGSTSSDSKRGKYGFGGIITRESVDPKKGIKYKIRLSSHINNVLNGDDDVNENIRLGLVVSENINTFTSGFLKTPFTIGTDEVKLLPFSSIMSPLGTVLHGSSSTATYTDDDGVVVPMKLKLEIYYTKPN
jgi:hypothetical protein